MTPRSPTTWRGPDRGGWAAAEYARRAGDRALAALAFEDAAHWYERAVASLAARRAGDDDQAGAALRLGTARLAAGDPDGGRAGFRQAAERARRAGRPDLLARAALGLGGGPAGFEVGLLDGEQISLLEEARSVLPDGQGTLVALVTARLSIASTLVLPEARRLELAAEAVRQARSAGDDGTLAASLAALCDAIAGPDHCAARLAHATEIIGIAARLRDPVLGLLGRRLRLVALLEAGAIADWDADALAYQIAAEALRHPLYAWYVPLWRGMRALAAGRADECRTALAEAADLGARAGSRNATMLVATQRWCLRAEEGDTAGLLAMLPELDTVRIPSLAPGHPGARAGPGRRAEDARAELEAVPCLPRWPGIRSGCPRGPAGRDPRADRPASRGALGLRRAGALRRAVRGRGHLRRGPRASAPPPGPAGRRARRSPGGGRHRAAALAGPRLGAQAGRTHRAGGRAEPAAGDRVSAGTGRCGRWATGAGRSACGTARACATCTPC